MKKLLLAAGLFIFPALAFAQTAVQIPSCSTAQPPTGVGSLYVDSTGSLCVRGNTGGFTSLVQSTPTVTATAYSSGQSVGGLITLANSARQAGTGLVQSVTATFVSGVQPSLDVVFFSANPTASTITNNAAVAIATADLPKIVGIVHVTDSSLLGASSPSLVQGLQQAMPYNATNGTMYAAVISRSAVTLTSTSDLTLTVRLLQD